MPHLAGLDVQGAYSFGWLAVSARLPGLYAFGGDLPDRMGLGAANAKATLMGEALGVQASLSGVLTAPSPNLMAPLATSRWRADGEAAASTRFGKLLLGGSIRAGMSGLSGMAGASVRLVEPLSLSVESDLQDVVGGGVRLRLSEGWVLGASGLAGIRSDAGLPKYQFGLSLLRMPVVPKPPAPKLPEPVPEPAPVVPEAVAEAAPLTPEVPPEPVPAAPVEEAPPVVAEAPPEAPPEPSPPPEPPPKPKLVLKVRVDVYGGKAKQAREKAAKVCKMVVAQGIYGKDCDIGEVKPGKGPTRVELVVIQVAE